MAQLIEDFIRIPLEKLLLRGDADLVDLGRGDSADIGQGCQGVFVIPGAFLDGCGGLNERFSLGFRDL